MDTARYNANGGRLYAAAFFCHQAAERALKALATAQTRERPPATHSLAVLGRRVNPPAQLSRFLNELTAEYMLSRYPNATDEIPARL